MSCHEPKECETRSECRETTKEVSQALLLGTSELYIYESNWEWSIAAGAYKAAVCSAHHHRYHTDHFWPEPMYDGVEPG